MPAILTHDFFGKDILQSYHDFIGKTKDTCDAFLLGNQGPDPLFYLRGVPGMKDFARLGSIMHDDFPASQLYSFYKSLESFNEPDKAIAQAYLMGFIAHYTLDSHMHPLVFAQQWAICDAGIEGLNRKHGGVVHGVIETDFDEMVLYLKRGECIDTYVPHKNVLHGSRHVLMVISQMYVHMAKEIFDMDIPTDLFLQSIRSFRRIQHLFYSPCGIKRAVLAGIEERFSAYSLYRSLSHRVRPEPFSMFDNAEHATWFDPFTGEARTESFWDLYDRAADAYDEGLKFALEEDLGFDDFKRYTHGLDFSGRPLKGTAL